MSAVPISRLKLDVDRGTSLVGRSHKLGLTGWPAEIALIDDEAKTILLRGDPEWKEGRITGCHYVSEAGDITLLIKA